MIHIKSQMIYERIAKDVSVEKKKEVLTALWDATSGLGEVTCKLLLFFYELSVLLTCYQ